MSSFHTFLLRPVLQAKLNKVREDHEGFRANVAAWLPGVCFGVLNYDVTERWVVLWYTLDGDPTPWLKRNRIKVDFRGCVRKLLDQELEFRLVRITTEIPARLGKAGKPATARVYIGPPRHGRLALGVRAGDIAMVGDLAFLIQDCSDRRVITTVIHVPHNGVPREVANRLALRQTEIGVRDGLYVGAQVLPTGSMRLTVRGDKDRWPASLVKKIRDPELIAQLD